MHNYGHVDFVENEKSYVFLGEPMAQNVSSGVQR
jgi:hypothetical protein